MPKTAGYAELSEYAAFRAKELSPLLESLIAVTDRYGELICQVTLILGKTPPASGYDTAICDLMADVFDFLMRRARSSPSEGASAAGGPLAGLTTDELAFFHAGLATFQAAEGIGDGLWPQFNLDSRSGCHSQPGIGGSSPAVNPQRNIGVADGAHNKVPSFVHPNGPIVEARLKYYPDGSQRPQR